MRRALPCLALVTACAGDPCLDAPPTGDCFAAGGATSISVGFHPAAARRIDLDGDGHLDLVTAHGTFQSLGAAWGPDHIDQTTWSIGQELSGLAVADLDRDGHLDLAATLPAADAVLVSFGATGRARDELREYPTGESPRVLAAADLDADGYPEIVTTNLGDGSITVLRFTGRDTTAEHHHVGAGPTALEIVDLDADARPDLLMTLADVDRVALLRGAGNTLSRPVTWPTGQMPSAVVALPDGGFAVAGALSDDLTIHAADGAIQHTWPIGQSPRALALQDEQLAVLTGSTAALIDPRTGDAAAIALQSDTDVLLTDPLAYLTRAGVRVDLTRTDGPRLTEQWHHAQDIVIFAAAAADLDGDGRLDLAVRPSATRLDLRLATTDGLALVRSLAMPDEFDIQAILPADLDGDGAAALLLVDPGEPTRLVVLAPDGAGDFLPYTAPIDLGAAHLTDLLIVDLDGDTREDLLIADSAPRVLLADDSTLAPAVPLPPFTGRPITIADIDGDSVPDLLVASTMQLDAILDPLGAALLASTPLPDNTLRDVAAADLDADGRTDVILCNDSGLQRGRGRGDGSFDITPLTPERRCSGVRLHDLDADGDLDILTTAQTTVDAWLATVDAFSLLTSQLVTEDAVFLDTPTGPAVFAHDYTDARLWIPTWGSVLSESTAPTTLPQLRTARFGDLDADGTADLVALADHHLFLGEVGDPTIDAHDLTALGVATPDRLLLLDLDADARDDIVLVTQTPDARATLVRIDPDDRHATLLTELPAIPDVVLAGDLDADGRADLVISHQPDITIHRSTVDGLIADPAQRFDGSAFALADLDGDRHLDLWLLDATDERLHVARRASDPPRFLPPQLWGGPADPHHARLYDHTGDGEVDLLSVHDGAILLFPGGPDGRAGPPRRLASARELEGLGTAWLPGDPRPALVATREGDPASIPLAIGRPIDSGGYAFHERIIPRLGGTTEILQPRTGADLIVVGPHGYTLVEAVP